MSVESQETIERFIVKRPDGIQLKARIYHTPVDSKMGTYVLSIGGKPVVFEIYERPTDRKSSEEAFRKKLNHYLEDNKLSR